MRTPRGISPRARAYVRRQASTIQHAGEVRIYRTGEASYDKESRLYGPKAVMVLYQGPFRLWEVTGRSGVAVGDSTVLIQSTNLSIPWDAVPAVPFADIPENMPRHGDQFEVLVHPTDRTIIGSTGEIQESAKAGELRATRRFAVTMAQSKGDHE